MLKYRVYDTRAKKYLDRKTVSIDGNGVLKIDKCALGNIIRTPHSRKNPMFIIEQYTGLEDKNGVEICEGDIVAFKHDNWDVQELRRVKYYGQFGYPAFDFSPSFDDAENGL